MGCGLKPPTSQKQVGGSDILLFWCRVCSLVPSPCSEEVRIHLAPAWTLQWVAHDGHLMDPILAALCSAPLSQQPAAS